jgi:hypothetical protein
MSLRFDECRNRCPPLIKWRGGTVYMLLTGRLKSGIKQRRRRYVIASLPCRKQRRWKKRHFNYPKIPSISPLLTWTMANGNILGATILSDGAYHENDSSTAFTVGIWELGRSHKSHPPMKTWQSLRGSAPSESMWLFLFFAAGALDGRLRPLQKGGRGA